MKFIEIDKVSVTLHNDNESDCHKLQKFQETSILHGCFSPCYRDHVFFFVSALFLVLPFKFIRLLGITFTFFVVERIFMVRIS